MTDKINTSPEAAEWLAFDMQNTLKEIQDG